MTTCEDLFKSDCDDIITGLNTAEQVAANKLVSLAANIGKKHPHVLLPEFLEDFMNGMFTSKMLQKYNLYSKDFHNMIQNTLKLGGTRSKNINFDNKKINLQNSHWKQQYESIMSQSHIFDILLVKMLNCNILKALFVHTILDIQYISNNDIRDKIIATYDKLKNNINILSDNAKRKSFEDYIQDDFDNKLQNIIAELTRKSLIVSIDGDVSLPAKYSEIGKKIYNIINEMKDGISHSSLRTKTLNEFPLFKIIFGQKILDKIIKELEMGYNIIRKQTFWKYSPDGDQLFTCENYNIKMEHINKQIVSRGRTKFFGRRITPDRFIDEIKTLQPGDLDDLDDQVTRMAGLVLSDSVQLQSPRENMKEFDFIVDITNYNFRPEQEEMMKKLDFQAISDIFHCKVMINDVVTLNKIKKLAKSIPNGEQGIIFTCNPVDSVVLQKIKDDKTIQIINEDGIRNWCSITPTIPCRLHSIAKVMYGEEASRIVLVRSLNYESGLATVETIPDRVETTFEIGRLQEIDLHVDDIGDFKYASERYADFCTQLAGLYDGDFEDAVNTQITKVYHSRDDLEKNERFGIYDDSYIKKPSLNAAKYCKYVKFDYVYTTVNLGPHSYNSFNCTCSHSLNEEYHRTLCKHLISAIIQLCTDELNWSAIERNIEYLTQYIVQFQEDNIKRMAYVIHDVMEPESRYLLSKYFQKYADRD